MINFIKQNQSVELKVCLPTWRQKARHPFFGALTLVVKAFVFIIFAAIFDITGLLFASTFTKTFSITDPSQFIFSEDEIVFSSNGATQLSQGGEQTIFTISDLQGGQFINTIIRNSAIELLGIQPEVGESALALFHFDETDGTIVEETGSMFAYSLLGGITAGAQSVWGNAFEFDGRDDAIDITFNERRRVGDITVSFWFNKSNLDSSTDYIIDARPNGNFWIINDYVGGTVCKNPNGNICFYDVVEITPDMLATNSWQHIAFTVTQTETRAYVNGNLVATGIGLAGGRYPGTAMYLGDTMRIGSRWNGSGYFQGKIDEIYLAGVALTSSQIADMARAYEEVGTYTSPIIDAGEEIAINDIELTKTNIGSATVYIRPCESAIDCSGTFVAWTSEESPLRTQHYQISLQLNATNAGFDTPSITSIIVEEALYPLIIVIQPISGILLTQTGELISIYSQETVIDGAAIRYQLSRDNGITWYWFNGTSWVTQTGFVDANTPAQINSALVDFDVSGGTVLWRAILTSDGKTNAVLNRVDLVYQWKTGSSGGYVAPNSNSPEQTALNNFVESDDGVILSQEGESCVSSDEIELREAQGIESAICNNENDSKELLSANINKVFAPRGQAFSPITGEVQEITSIVSGQYIRSESFSTVYYVTEEYHRRPFWNTQAFLTWENSFDNVLWVTDATLTVLPLATPMMPRPETVLVKIQSDSNVYWTQKSDANEMDFTLRWISKEQIAKEVFGENWHDYVMDIEPTLFGNLKFGSPIYQTRELYGGNYNLYKIQYNEPN